MLLSSVRNSCGQVYSDSTFERSAQAKSLSPRQYHVIGQQRNDLQSTLCHLANQYSELWGRREDRRPDKAATTKNPAICHVQAASVTGSLYHNQALLCLAPSSKIRRCKSKTSKYSVGRTFTARAPLILFSLRRFSACLRVTTVERGCQPIPGLLALLRKAIRRTLPIRHGKRLEPCTAPPESDATWKRTTSAFCRENTRHIPLTNLPH